MSVADVLVVLQHILKSLIKKQRVLVLELLIEKAQINSIEVFERNATGMQTSVWTPLTFALNGSVLHLHACIVGVSQALLMCVQAQGVEALDFFMDRFTVTLDECKRLLFSVCHYSLLA